MYPTEQSAICSGFTALASVNSSKTERSILVPQHVQSQLDRERREQIEKRESAKAAQSTSSQASAGNLLASIRLNSDSDLLDALSMTSRLLTPALSQLNRVYARYFSDLMTATLLYHAYRRVVVADWKIIVDFLVDPNWDSNNQMLCELLNSAPNENTDAACWKRDSIGPLVNYSTSDLKRLIKRCHATWVDAVLNHPTYSGKLKTNLPRRPRQSIRIFDMEALSAASTHVERIDEKQRDRAETDLEAARATDGFRLAPNARKAIKNLDALANDFENLAEPIQHLKVELSLAGAMSSDEFRLSPILLVGDPGIGKTHLALQLAKALGVPMKKISAGGAQGGFQLTGSHPSWTRSMPGLIFTTLAHGASAAPVLVIDEVDKIGRGGSYPLEPTLFDLLEPETAHVFKDEFFDLVFDASRIIYVLTANDLHAVPEPLQSRVTIFQIPRPTEVQRLRIIEMEVTRLRAKTRKRITLDDTAHDLARHCDLDLRQTIRAVHEGFSKALTGRKPTASVVLPNTIGKRSIGFTARA